MKNFILQAAKMLAGVRMLRCAMMLALLCSPSAGAEAQVAAVSWGNGIFVGYRITLYCGKCHAYTQQQVTQIISYPCTGEGMFEAMCRSCDGLSKYGIHRIGSHDWADWKGDDTPATCTTPSGRYHACKRCGTTEHEQPALGHNMSWTTVAATCTTGGYEHGHCQRSGCNYEETRNQTAALGHDFALNHNCTRCDAVDPAKQPTGCLDNCAGGELQISLNGWAYDPNVPSTPIDMHVYVYQSDGTTRYGDIHIINANLERPDLATALSIPTNHGYSTTIPIADAGTYKVKVYAIDLNGDGNPQIGSTQTVTVTGVPYIAANGQAQICNSATRLTGGAATTLSSGWYYVTGEVNYTGCLTLDGDATIILCDGATLNIGSSESRLTTHCILGEDYTLTVYGQGQQTGALYCYNRTSERKDKFGNFQGYKANSTALMSQFTQYGGNVTFDLNVHSSIVSSPYPVEANVDYRGGHFTANGGYGIKGTVNINWSDPDNRFRTSGFGPNGTGGTVTIASDKAFTDGTNYYAGTLDNAAKVSTQGRTLWPVTAISLSDNASNSTAVTKLNGVNNLDVTLSDRTLWKDGAWNTLCLPFAVSTTSAPLSGDGVQAMTLNTATSGFDNGTLTLNFNAAPTTIPAGTPFIIKWNNMGTTIEEPEFTGVTISNATNNANSSDGKVTFKGTYAPMTFTEENKSILFLGTANTLYYPKVGASIKAQRAYFQLSEELRVKSEESPVKAFILNFGEDSETGLNEELRVKSEESDNVYDLSGRRINSQFSTLNSQLPKGIYIVNGKKILK
jgi:hypothetical protein